MCVFASTLCGCAKEVTYTRVQKEDGVAMKAPITFTVRIRLDADNKVVTWMEDLVDSQGATHRDIRTYGGSSLSACAVFDEKNWNCEIHGVNGDVLERPEMRDGALSRYYWGKKEEYRRHRRFF